MFLNKSLDPPQVTQIVCVQLNAVLTSNLYGNSMITILTDKITVNITGTLISKINDKMFENTGRCFCTCLHKRTIHSVVSRTHSVIVDQLLKEFSPNNEGKSCYLCLVQIRPSCLP